MTTTEMDRAAATALPPPGRRPPAVPPRLSREQASRFLSQAAFGGSGEEITKVMAAGYDQWLGGQFALPPGPSYVSLISPGGPDDDGGDGRVGVQQALWRKFIGSPDLLRQRVVLALSEIFVISIQPVLLPQRGFACAAFMDILEAHAFGNYRDLLLKVSTNPAMGAYLTFRNNVKANPATGSQPDENYARELMQLFSIGLLQLNANGTPVMRNDRPAESYTQDDVLGMARVFTGWALSGAKDAPNAMVTQPMRQIASRHEPGIKQFLGTTIPANTDGVTSLGLAIDTLMAHPNIGPFIGRQLIQRLVTSDPSPAYVARVAAAFNGDTRRPKGDMQATLRAVFLDDEARSTASLVNPRQGKLREPMLRFMQWARLVNLSPLANGRYTLGNLIDPAKGLGQSPLRAPSVFNFFRPGHVPPNTELGNLGITAPEFQITNESSVAGYLNFMHSAITRGINGMAANHDFLLPLATDPAALVGELNVLLAAGQLSPATVGSLAAALGSIEGNSPAGQRNRVLAAQVLVLAAPEYIVLK